MSSVLEFSLVHGWVVVTIVFTLPWTVPQAVATLLRGLVDRVRLQWLVVHENQNIRPALAGGRR